MPDFPFPFHIIEEKKEVWMVCRSTIEARTVPSLMKQHFPGYTPCLCGDHYLQKLRTSLG